jgi:hypothetical protein
MAAPAHLGTVQANTELLKKFHNPKWIFQNQVEMVAKTNTLFLMYVNTTKLFRMIKGKQERGGAFKLETWEIVKDGVTVNLEKQLNNIIGPYETETISAKAISRLFSPESLEIFTGKAPCFYIIGNSKLADNPQEMTGELYKVSTKTGNFFDSKSITLTVVDATNAQRKGVPSVDKFFKHNTKPSESKTALDMSDPALKLLNPLDCRIPRADADATSTPPEFRIDGDVATGGLFHPEVVKAALRILARANTKLIDVSQPDGIETNIGDVAENIIQILLQTAKADAAAARKLEERRSLRRGY